MIGKEDIQLFLFVDDIVLYIENPKDTTRKLLEVFTSFNEFFFILFCRFCFCCLLLLLLFFLHECSAVVSWKIEHHSVFQVTYLFYLSSSAIYSFLHILHFSYCIIYLFSLFFNSSRFLINISCIFLNLPPFFSNVLDHLHYNFSELFFSEVCLSPLYLVVLLGFSLVLISGTYSDIFYCLSVIVFSRLQNNSTCFYCLFPGG